MAKVENRNGKVWYGLHFAPGVAEYQDARGEKPYRILLNADVTKAMDPTMQGNPLFVLHTKDPDLKNGKEDGWVLESFFNQADGFHWAKFITVTPEAEDAIAKGWTLSNAYHPQYVEKSGEWHGVSYSKEVVNGEYEHLALVPNPRYTESRILSPEQFKQYNEQKKAELVTLRNSKDKGEGQMAWKLFGGKKIENLKDIEDFETLQVELPNSHKMVKVVDVLKNADEREAGGNMAELSHMVKLHDGKTCNVGELMEAHRTTTDAYNMLKKNYDELAAAVAEKEEGKGKHENETDEEKEAREKKENEEKEKREKEEKEKKENANNEHKRVLEAAKALKNAKAGDGVTVADANSGPILNSVFTENDGFKRAQHTFGMPN